MRRRWRELFVLVFLTAACSDETDPDPLSLAESDLRAVLLSDGEAIWDRLHPERQVSTTRAAFLDCYGAYGQPDPSELDGIAINAQFVEELDGDFTRVNVVASADGEQVDGWVFYLPDQDGQLRLAGLLPHTPLDETCAEGIYPWGRGSR